MSAAPAPAHRGRAPAPPPCDAGGRRRPPARGDPRHAPRRPPLLRPHEHLGRHRLGRRLEARARSVSRFTAVDLAGFNNVVVRAGGRQSVVVHADGNLLRRVTTRVRAGRLVIGTTPGNLAARSPMYVVVTLPSVEALTLRMHQGNIIVSDLDSRRLTVRLPGAGTIRATGRAARLDVTISGSGTALLGQLVARDVKAGVSGDGSIVSHGDPPARRQGLGQRDDRLRRQPGADHQGHGQRHDHPWVTSGRAPRRQRRGRCFANLAMNAASSFSAVTAGDCHGQRHAAVAQAIPRVASQAPSARADAVPIMPTIPKSLRPRLPRVAPATVPAAPAPPCARRRPEAFDQTRPRAATRRRALPFPELGAAAARRSAEPVGARPQRLGERVLQRGRALDEHELAQLPLRLVRSERAHDGRQAAARAVGPGPLGPGVRLSCVEHPRAPGAHGRRDGRTGLRPDAPPVGAHGRASSPGSCWR